MGQLKLRTVQSFARTTFSHGLAPGITLLLASGWYSWYSSSEFLTFKNMEFDCWYMGKRRRAKGDINARHRPHARLHSKVATVTRH